LCLCMWGRAKKRKRILKRGRERGGDKESERIKKS